MEYSSYNIGKIRTFDNYTGEIVAQDGVYIFTSESIEPSEVLFVEDTVLFRGEEINDIKKAFFVKKINPNLNLEDQVYKHVKKPKVNKENE